MANKLVLLKQMAAAAVLTLAANGLNAATIVDLSSYAVGEEVAIGDGLFKHADAETNQPKNDPFLTTQDDEDESGGVDAFNGTEDTTPPNGNPDAIYEAGKTHTITVGDLLETDPGGYYAFLFDANQVGASGGEYINIETLEVWVSADGTLDELSDLTGANGTLLYSLDGLEGTTLIIDGAHGTGGADMFFFLPTSLAWGSDSNYVYLRYSYTNGVNGREHWALPDVALDNPIPEPGTLALLGLGLAGLGFSRRKKS